VKETRSAGHGWCHPISGDLERTRWSPPEHWCLTTIKVDYLARVEGEGALIVKIQGHRLIDVRLKIFEPPRFFEAFLRGRKYSEVPDITARICGICPVAYQMSACHAIEDAFGVKVEGPLRDLRRLLYCGEWIESHALHVYMLHAPDFLGYEDSLSIAKDHPDTVKRGLRIKKTGNEIVNLLGGLEIHPVNVRVAGFYKIPRKQEFAALTENLKWARDAAVETVRWVPGFLNATMNLSPSAIPESTHQQGSGLNRVWLQRLILPHRRNRTDTGSTEELRDWPSL
jgi:coenzyme F420-reducing hydrogenase alpha subunit